MCATGAALAAEATSSRWLADAVFEGERGHGGVHGIYMASDSFHPSCTNRNHCNTTRGYQVPLSNLLRCSTKPPKDDTNQASEAKIPNSNMGISKHKPPDRVYPNRQNKTPKKEYKGNYKKPQRPPPSALHPPSRPVASRQPTQNADPKRSITVSPSRGSRELASGPTSGPTSGAGTGTCGGTRGAAK